MKEEIYIIIRSIGDLADVVDKAYYYYSEASKRAAELQEKDHSAGWIDFQYSVQTLEIVGLK